MLVDQFDCQESVRCKPVPGIKTADALEVIEDIANSINVQLNRLDMDEDEDFGTGYTNRDRQGVGMDHITLGATSYAAVGKWADDLLTAVQEIRSRTESLK